MRYSGSILQFLPLLLLWNLTALPCSHSSVLLPTNLQTIQLPPPLPFQAPLDLPPKAQDDRRPWARFRDRLIRFLWNIPIQDQSRTPNFQPSWETFNPPSSLKARYGGDVVLRFQIQSREESTALSEAIYVLMLDVWEFTADWVDIRLSKDMVPSLLGLLPASLQRAHTPLIYDLTQAILESYPPATFDEPTSPVQAGYRTFSPDLHPSTDETNIFFRNYQPLSVIVPWMRLLSSLFPTHVRMLNIGLSYEGRDIPALRVGVHPTNSEKPSAPRKTIIITGGSHAREWISTSSVNYVAYSFITAYGRSPPMTELLEKFDWIFIPTLNPDGYVYTWESDRLWRKNRQQTGIRFCKGVDLDRTFSFEWDGASWMNNPCSESFAGEAPLQGVESSRFVNWIRNETAQNHANIVAFLDFHSYSQQVLYPYSYSCTSTPPSLENLEELAIGMAKAIWLTNGRSYGVTSACEGSVLVENDDNKANTVDGNKKKTQQDKQEVWTRMESGGGSALDWFYHEIHVRYAYQIKLPDTGSYGFLLPSQNIVPTGKEALSAVKYLGEFLLRNNSVAEVVVLEGDNATESENRGGGAMKKEQAGGKESELLTESSTTGVFETAEEAVRSQDAEEEEEEKTAETNWELRRRRRRK